MEEDKEYRDTFLKLAERAASALEQLAADPIISVESGPPICPHCGTLNPTVSVREGESSGPLYTFVIQAVCKSCQSLFYVLPQMWLCLKTVEEIREEVENRERDGLNGGN